MQAADGRAAGERGRLQFELEEAGRVRQEAAQTSSFGRVSEATEGEREARQSLAELEVNATGQRTELQRQIAERSAAQTEARQELEDLAERLGEIERQIDHLETGDRAERTRQLEEQLEELAPIVEAQREAVGASGVADLSHDYLEQAVGHARAWKLWGVSLAGAMIAAAVGGLILFSHDKVPTGKITGATAIDLTRNLFVVGLLLYAIRMTSLQFRVHRHLEAVARNKAAALATFNRIVVVASEKEIRNSLAIVLAQAVFSSDETGFVDASQDHVTLIERLAASAPRPGT